MAVFPTGSTGLYHCFRLNRLLCTMKFELNVEDGVQVVVKTVAVDEESSAARSTTLGDIRAAADRWQLTISRGSQEPLNLSRWIRGSVGCVLRLDALEYTSSNNTNFARLYDVSSLLVLSLDSLNAQRSQLGFKNRSASDTYSSLLRLEVAHGSYHTRSFQKRPISK